MLIAIWSPGMVASAAIKMPRVEMSYRKLGSSDLLVSSCCLGTMTWGNQNTDEEAAAQLNLAWDMGVNFLDTAEIYPVPVSEATQGATDRAIGKWLKHSKRARDEVIIASKVAGYNERFTWLRGGPTRVTREQIHASVDASLKRLGVEHLDLLQIHWPDRYVPMFGTVAYDCSKERAGSVTFEEQARAMGELVSSGKIRAWGLSNETPLGVSQFVHAATAEGAPPPVSVQNSYSLLDRRDEVGLVEAMRHHGVAYLPYSPLSAGLLTGKYSGSPSHRSPRGFSYSTPILIDTRARVRPNASTATRRLPSTTASRPPRSPSPSATHAHSWLRPSSERRAPSSSRSTYRDLVSSGPTSSKPRLHASTTTTPTRGACSCVEAADARSCCDGALRLLLI
jgi:aryl-alcohol dehydrogenase-like predicted oxidoreductase